MRARKNNKNVFRSLAFISQFGINMLVPIFICSFVGIFLDKELGTSFCMIILFFIGSVAGFRNIYIVARQIYGDKEREHEKAVKKDKQNTD